MGVEWGEAGGVCSLRPHRRRLGIVAARRRTRSPLGLLLRRRWYWCSWCGSYHAPAEPRRAHAVQTAAVAVMLALVLRLAGAHPVMAIALATTVAWLLPPRGAAR